MKLAKSVLALLTLLLFGSVAQAAETYAPPNVKIKEQRAVVKVERETVEDTKSFGQFENKEEQERELASDLETSRDPSSNPKKQPEKKMRSPMAPQKMLWKDRRD